MKRLRIRIDDYVAERLAALRPVLRARVISMVLSSHLGGGDGNTVDLLALLDARRELIRLGVLINASLRLSHGTTADLPAVRRAAAIINSLTHRA